MSIFCCKCFKELPLEDSWYGLHKNCFKNWFNVEESSQFLDLIVRSQSQSPIENCITNISFFNGAYRNTRHSLETLASY